MIVLVTATQYKYMLQDIITYNIIRYKNNILYSYNPSITQQFNYKYEIPKLIYSYITLTTQNCQSQSISTSTNQTNQHKSSNQTCFLDIQVTCQLLGTFLAPFKVTCKSEVFHVIIYLKFCLVCNFIFIFSHGQNLFFTFPPAPFTPLYAHFSI